MLLIQDIKNINTLIKYGDGILDGELRQWQNKELEEQEE